MTNLRSTQDQAVPGLSLQPARPSIAAPRLLHTMLRVRHLNDSLDFYVSQLGMRLLRRQNFVDGRFTLAFVGYGEESESAVIELTHNWDAPTYDIGTSFGHIAIGVSDVYGATRRLQESGVKVTRPPGPLKGDPSELIAFVEDPDGYKVELIQTKLTTYDDGRQSDAKNTDPLRSA